MANSYISLALVKTTYKQEAAATWRLSWAVRYGRMGCALWDHGGGQGVAGGVPQPQGSALKQIKQ